MNSVLRKIYMKMRVSTTDKTSNVLEFRSSVLEAEKMGAGSREEIAPVFGEKFHWTPSTSKRLLTWSRGGETKEPTFKSKAEKKPLTVFQKINNQFASLQEKSALYISNEERSIKEGQKRLDERRVDLEEAKKMMMESKFKQFTKESTSENLTSTGT
jgi:hypothetical protein